MSNKFVGQVGVHIRYYDPFIGSSWSPQGYKLNDGSFILNKKIDSLDFRFPVLVSFTIGLSVVIIL